MLFGLLIAAALQDIRFGRISNRLIVTGLVIGFIFQITEYQVLGVYLFLRNISVPVILLYLLFQMRVLGAGDIKLFSMIGSILTIWELFRCILYSFFAAAAGGILFLAADKRRWSRVTYAKNYVLDFLRMGKIKAYDPPYKAEILSFAFSVPILFGTMMALYIPVGY